MILEKETPKQTAEKALEAIELARTTGKLKKGGNEVTKAVERGTAKLVVIASDTNPIEIVMHLPALCAEKKIPIVEVSKKEELGTAAGLPVSTTAVAITEEGNSKELISEISEDLK
ncbi:50S ribosomal protein L7Ae [Candidatus Woesearchaeota archaeon]|nr:50S ribosomal protein L7Ae [Candidatus Woesearchaeota archaeon]